MMHPRRSLRASRAASEELLGHAREIEMVPDVILGGRTGGRLMRRVDWTSNHRRNLQTSPARWASRPCSPGRKGDVTLVAKL